MYNPKPRSTRAYARAHMAHKVPHGIGPWVGANGVVLNVLNLADVTPEVHHPRPIPHSPSKSKKIASSFA